MTRIMETVQKGGNMRPQGTSILMHDGEKATNEQNRQEEKSQEVALSRSAHE